MTLKEHLRRNITLAFPVMIGQLGHIAVSVADSVMVGRVGVVPLAGVTFASTIYHVLMLFGIGVSYAITPLVSADSRDKTKILGFLQNGFVLNVIIGLMLAGLGYAASNFLNYFGQKEAVVVIARPYLLIVCISLLPLMIFQTFRQFSEGLSDTFSPMIVSLVANLVNISLNYVLIYGKYGIPALGPNGAGYATLISRICMFILMIWLLRKKWRGFEWNFQMTTIRRLLKLGIPSGMQYVFETGAFAMAAIMVGWIGAEALAAHNIALSLAAITYMTSTGLGASASIRIGNQMGLRDKHNLRIAGFSGFGTVAVFMLICGFSFILLRDWLPALYVEDVNVQSMASALLIVVAAFQVSDGLQVVGLGVLRGLTDVRVPTLVTFVSYWLITIPTAYFFGFVMNWGIRGIWYALLLGLTIAAILLICRFNILSRKLPF